MNIFSGQSSKATEIKAKNKPMGPNQTDKLLHSKGNHKKTTTATTKKTTYRMGENSFKQCNRKGLNLLNIQTTYTAQQPKSQQPN